MGQAIVETIAISLGDPAGVGAEVTVRALEELARTPVATQLRVIIFGQAELLHIGDQLRSCTLNFAPLTPGRQDVDHTGLPVSQSAAGLPPCAQASLCNPHPELASGTVAVYPAAHVDAPPAFGQVRAEYGEFAYQCLRQAVEFVRQAPQQRSLVTAPLCKASLAAAGYGSYPSPGTPGEGRVRVSGHTELLAQWAGIEEPVMLLMNPQLKVALVTRHLPLAQVPAAITTDLILTVLRVIEVSAPRVGWAKPRVALLGLNPHAGESGELGREEIEIIQPAAAQARAEGIAVSDPIPADTAFHRALAGEFDVVLAMYHDQGLGPLKAISFKDVVNVTLGLPYLRTSPGHGTAFDIAGKGLADPTSMKCAIMTALAR